MYFMIQHRHDYSTCQAHNQETAKEIGDIVTNSSEHNILVRGRYRNRLEHKNFILWKPIVWMTLTHYLISFWSLGIGKSPL